MKSPVLEHLGLSASQFWLQHSDEGPRWKIKLWAAKRDNPSHDAEVGDVYISTANGSVIRADLHPDRVN